MTLQAQKKTITGFAYTPALAGLLQRKCACGGSPGISGICDECSNKQLNVQRHAADQAEPSNVPHIVSEVLSSPGQPLDAKTRAFMQPRFGHDFSRVRVHTDARAAESAAKVNALAYTVGRNVVFGAGQFAPMTDAGQRLMAHELAHTIQQSDHSSSIQAKLDVSSPDDPSEREADAVSENIMQGQSVAMTQGCGTQLARATPDTDDVGPSTDALPMGGDAGASACPVKSTGTLSEVSWGETSGLYPSNENKYQPEKWDQAKTCELLKARGAVHAVGQRGESVREAKPKSSDAIEQKLKIYHFTENFPALDSEISDTEVKWFFLSPDSDKPAVHPGAAGTTRVKSYGSFYNIGGGDVKKGDVYIHFYKLKPKATKPEEAKPKSTTPLSGSGKAPSPGNHDDANDQGDE